MDFSVVCFSCFFAVFAAEAFAFFRAKPLKTQGICLAGDFFLNWLLLGFGAFFVVFFLVFLCCSLPRCVAAFRAKPLKMLGFGLVGDFFSNQVSAAAGCFCGFRGRCFLLPCIGMQQICRMILGLAHVRSACSVAASYKPPMLVTRVRLPACAVSRLT